MPQAANIRNCESLINELMRKMYFPAALPVYEQILTEIIAE